MSQMVAIYDKLLTGASNGYFPKGYISEKLLPKVFSVETTGKLGKYGTSHLRIENAIKGGRGKYPRVETITRTTSSYSIEGHGLEGMVTKEDYRNVQKPFDAERDETLGLSTLLWLGKEKSLADTLTDTAVLTQNTTLSGTSQLSDYSNSDPVSVFKTARATIRNACGQAPNVGLMDWQVWNVVRYHPQLLDALGFKYDRPGGLTEQEMASVLGVQRVEIADCVYESAKEGQTSSLAAVWGKHIVLAVLPEVAAPYQVSLGYEVRYDGEPPRKVSKWDLNNPSGSRAILCEDDYDQFLSNVAAGYLVKNAIA